MRSYYGNLLADIFEMLFAIVSLLLVWVSNAKDANLFFGITALIYILPRILSIISGIVNNAHDIFRLVVDYVALIALLVSFVMVCILMLDLTTLVIKATSEDNINLFFYIFSGISLLDIVYKVIVGIVQKFSVAMRNSSTK